MHRHGAGAVLSLGQVGERLLCSKLAIPPGGCLVLSFPATLPEGPESPRLLPHLWETQTHCGAGGEGDPVPTASLWAQGLAGREDQPGTTLLGSGLLLLLPPGGTVQAGEKQGMGAGGVGSQFPSKKPQGRPQGPQQAGPGFWLTASFWGTQGHPSGEAKGPETPPPQLREWSKAGEPRTAVYY